MAARGEGDGVGREEEEEGEGGKEGDCVPKRAFYRDADFSFTGPLYEQKPRGMHIEKLRFFIQRP